MKNTIESVTDGFCAFYGEGYEEMLPRELTEEYEIEECLSCAEDCDTLLLRQKASGNRAVTKCYAKDSAMYGTTEAVALKDIESEVIPRFVGEYRNEEYRCVLREYIEGTPLDEFVKANYMAQDVITDIAIELASTMKCLHGLKPPVIHRDIKPRNIIVKKDGSVALIDLGISRVYKKDVTSDTAFCGTEEFAPPEQYGFLQTDIRSDIYSFGIVLAWMITGKAKPITAPLNRLERVAAKCCAFSPDKRYKSDTALLRDLYRATREHAAYMRRVKRWAVCLLCLAVLLSVGWIGERGGDLSGTGQTVTFREPLIEEAVRVMLDKPEGGITRADLEQITGIYIQADEVYAHRNGFYNEGAEWYDDDIRIKGPIRELSDLENMPNLKEVLIGGESIQDISALRGLTKLWCVDFRDNEISDISPLADMDTLTNVCLCGNWLDSIDTVSTWRSVEVLNLDWTGNYDAGPVAGLKHMNSLSIFRASDAYRYLDGLKAEELFLGAKGQTDLACMDGVDYVGRLDIKHSDISDISSLRGREDVTYLNIEGCLIEDLSVLFDMPNLETVQMDAKEESRMEELALVYGEPGFELQYIK